ncbi:integrase/recombinase (plasmid) [[Synechococcus] sp. NIES-970]|nr:integrase/recombinase [[Synechococcus] sp. NIES-970]
MGEDLSFAPMSSLSSPTQQLIRAAQDDNVIELWLSRVNLRSRQTYHTTIRQFQLHFEFAPLHRITLEDLIQWQQMLSLRYSQNTQRSKVSIIKSLFNFAHRAGYLQVNPVVLLKTPNAHPCLHERILTKSQVEAVVLHADSDRNELIAQTLYTLGLRVSELVEMKWSDFSPTDTGMRLRVIGKGNKQRHINIPDHLYQYLQRLRGDSPYVFRSRQGPQLTRQQVYNIIKSLGDRLNIRLSPHYLRHSHATHSLAGGCPLKLLSDNLGHSNISVTSNYLHANETDGSANYLPAMGGLNSA